MTTESSTTVEWQNGAAGEATAYRADVSDRGGEPTEAQSDLSLDVTFELLKNPRRRLVLQYLQPNPTTTLSTLAEHVASLENEKPVRELSSVERKRVYISLYQCHLPKLDDADVIDFDSNRGTVERNPRADHFEPYLTKTTGGQSSGSDVMWYLYYLGLAIAGAGLLAVHLLLIPAMATSAIAGIVIVSFAGLALFHARHQAAPAAR